jgi:hypothetical protein
MPTKTQIPIAQEIQNATENPAEYTVQIKDTLQSRPSRIPISQSTRRIVMGSAAGLLAVGLGLWALLKMRKR